MTGRPNLAPLLQAFFTQRLMKQRQASAHTIASYRDTWRLLLQFVQKRLHKAPSTLALEDIDAPLITAFLDDLEKVRGVTGDPGLVVFAGDGPRSPRPLAGSGPSSMSVRCPTPMAAGAWPIVALAR